MTEIKHVYEVRPRKDHRGVAAISDALPCIIALIVGGVLVFILLYFGSFLVTRRQDAAYEVRPRRDNAALISFPMRGRSVGWAPAR